MTEGHLEDTTLQWPGPHAKLGLCGSLSMGP